jgi:hypothetical protein
MTPKLNGSRTEPPEDYEEFGRDDTPRYMWLRWCELVCTEENAHDNMTAPQMITISRPCGFGQVT